MIFRCSSCGSDYDETDEQNIVFGENGCQMICKLCSNKNWCEWEKRVNSKYQEKNNESIKR